MRQVQTTWFDAVATTQAPALDDACGRAGLAPTAYATTVADHLHDVVRLCELRLRLWPEHLLAILRDGQLKNGFHFKESSYRDPSYWQNRANAEHTMFQDVPADPEAAEPRPVYGYLYDREEPPATELEIDELRRLEGYGQVVVVFHEWVKVDCTYTFGDTLVETNYCRDHAFCPSPHEERHHLPYDHRAGDPLAVSRATAFATGSGTNLAWNYIEAQVHGGLTPADIERVVFLNGAPGAELLEELARHSIDVEVAQ